MRAPNFKDLSNQHFGRLVVIEFAGHNRFGQTLWKCRCSCGNEAIVRAICLKNNYTRSCGCLAKEKRYFDLIGRRFGKLVVTKCADVKTSDGHRIWVCRCDCGKEYFANTHGLRRGTTRHCGCSRKNRTHGRSNSPEHRIWMGITKRCRKPTKNYSNIGVRICDRWQSSFANFYADVGPRPTPEHSIDRWPNPFGNYEPGNVRWATRKEQNRNRRYSLKLEFNGQTKLLVVWCEELGIRYLPAYRRLRRGMSAAAILLKG